MPIVREPTFSLVMEGEDNFYFPPSQNHGHWKKNHQEDEMFLLNCNSFKSADFSVNEII